MYISLLHQTKTVNNLKMKIFEGYTVEENGNITNKYGKVLKPYLNRKGYKTIQLKRKGFLVHRIIAMCFIPNPKNKPQVNHIDGNPSNNNISNLEWCNNRENVSHYHFNKTNNPTGASFYKKTKKWYSQIRINGKNTSLGYYKTKEEASEAYQRKLKEIIK